MRTCSGINPISSCSSRNIACSGLSPRSMPPCGNCQLCVRMRLPQNTWFFRLSRIMPTLGLKPSRSSIITPQIFELSSLCTALQRAGRAQQFHFPPSNLMRASQFLISTLKEAPADAEVASHKLMMRAGMIKKLGAGIYTYMPMGLRVIRKVEAIVREEMDRAGAVECAMPVVQPAELWQESGRFDKMGPELLRIKDRHDRDFVVQPTSGEVVTDIARQELRSYKQLPKNLYQVQTKFRDERRPRFGLMRGREFIMKDAYSFDRDLDAAKRSYQQMAKAYRAIFDRFGLRYRAVAADSGAIGGDVSQEFQVIADTGEDAIVYCPDSDYAANMEKAEALPPPATRAAAKQPMTRTATPGKSTCADVAALLGVPLQSTV